MYMYNLEMNKVYIQLKIQMIYLVQRTDITSLVVVHGSKNINKINNTLFLTSILRNLIFMFNVC